MATQAAPCNPASSRTLAVQGLGAVTKSGACEGGGAWRHGLQPPAPETPVASALLDVVLSLFRPFLEMGQASESEGGHGAHPPHRPCLTPEPVICGRTWVRQMAFS